MKPVSLKFKNFGPFRAEQYIDFTEFEKSGLFLIYGNTGSGKTTILDAMCCALYCESSNGVRFGSGKSALENMRCQQADPKESTFVEYIFENNGHKYRFFREIKLNSGGVNFNHTDICSEYDGSEFVPLESNLTMEKVSAYARKVVGLNADQFRQVVILPQGKFEELLTSDSKSKEEIITGIFNADKWDDLARTIKGKVDAETRELGNEKSAIDAIFTANKCEDIEGLKKCLDERLSISKENTEKEKAIKSEISVLESKDRNQRELSIKYNELDKRKEEFERLSKEFDGSSSDYDRIACAESAQKIKPEYDRKREAVIQETESASDFKKASLDLSAGMSAVKTAEAEKSKHENLRKSAENSASMAVSLENKRSFYEDIEKKKAAFEDATRQSEALKEIESVADSAYRNSDIKMSSAQKKLESAENALKNARNIYDRNISGILAKGLEDGKACPVCGSLIHPDPAKETEETISKGELDALEEKRNAAETEYKNAQTELEKKKAELDKAKSDKNAADIRKAKAESEYKSVKDNMAEGISSLDQLEEQIQKLYKVKSDFEEKETALRSAYEEALSKYNTCLGICKAAEEKVAKAKDKSQVCAEAWNKALNESDFSSEDEFVKSVMDSDEISRLKESLNELKAKHTSASKEYADAVKKVKGTSRPDVDATALLLQEKRDEFQQISNASALNDMEIKKLKSSITDAEKRLVSYALKAEKNRKNQLFAGLLMGTNGVSLKRYVLGTMLDLVTAQANEMLNSIYGGRYRIMRTSEKSGRSRISGLAFEIEDFQCDSKRSATDISGGEKFLVSLSLAIGLSNVVRAQGGGINLEAIFVDEGFGTLDKHCLDDAMFILQAVKEQNGMVGVISHVESLAENIPAKIETVKTDLGNRCEFHYE